MKAKIAYMRIILKDTFAILTGYIVCGLAMGLLAQKTGYPWWLVFCMAVFLYAGSMQFAAIDLLAAGTGFFDIAIVTLLIQGRHMFYGLSLLDRYKNDWIIKPYMIHSLTDETYAVHATSKPPADMKRGMYDLCVASADHLYWFCGCMLGAFAGSLIPFNLSGLEFAMPAFFIASFVDQWRASKTKLPALIGLALGIIFLVLLGANNFLIPAIAASIAVLFLLKKPIENKIDSD